MSVEKAGGAKGQPRAWRTWPEGAEEKTVTDSWALVDRGLHILVKLVFRSEK